MPPKINLNFHILRIRIGEWNRVSVNANDLRAKCFFLTRKLVWEVFDYDQRAGTILGKRMEIPWDDVLSFKFNASERSDNIEILEVELSKRPRFFVDNDPQPRRRTQWKETDNDFTENRSASTYRRHILEFASGVLRVNLSKLVSGDVFWQQRYQVPFPTLPASLYFEPDGNNNNFLPLQPGQGSGSVGVGEGSSNTVNQSLGPQVTEQQRELRNEAGELVTATTAYAWGDDGRCIAATVEQSLRTQVTEQQRETRNEAGELVRAPTAYTWGDDGRCIDATVEHQSMNEPHVGPED